MLRIAEHPGFPVDVAFRQLQAVVRNGRYPVILSKLLLAPRRIKATSRCRTPKPASPAVGTQPHVKSPMHPCTHAALLRRGDGAALPADRLGRDGALADGAVPQLDGRQFAEPLDAVEPGPLVLADLSRRHSHLLSADPFTTDEHGWTNYPSCSSCPSAFAESIAASAEDSW